MFAAAFPIVRAEPFLEIEEPKCSPWHYRLVDPHPWPELGCSGKVEAQARRLLHIDMRKLAAPRQDAEIRSLNEHFRPQLLVHLDPHPIETSFGSDFNFDYQASFTPNQLAEKRAFYNFAEQDPGFSEREGVSIFYKDRNGDIFHTYSTYARGIDMMNVDYQYLDLVPKGRDENGKGPFWVRRHDEYGQGS